jgi:hypothetical protein
VSELGSDRQLHEVADTSAVNAPVRREQLRNFVEEWRTRSAPQAEDEPGVDYPDPDEAPPADEPHDEFDPLPPEEPT